MEDVTSLYTVRKAGTEDALSVYNLLAPVVINTKKTSDGQHRDGNRLRNNIALGLKEDLLLVLEEEGDIVGTQLLQDRGGKLPLIVHSNILDEHKGTYGSALLFNEVVNVLFKGREVFISGVTEEYESVVDHVQQDLYKIKSSAKRQVASFVSKG